MTRVSLQTLVMFVRIAHLILYLVEPGNQMRMNYGALLHSSMPTMDGLQQQLLMRSCYLGLYDSFADQGANSLNHMVESPLESIIKVIGSVTSINSSSFLNWQYPRKDCSWKWKLLCANIIIIKD